MVELGGGTWQGKLTSEEIQRLWHDDKEEQRGKDEEEESQLIGTLERVKLSPLHIKW